MVLRVQSTLPDQSRHEAAERKVYNQKHSARIHPMQNKKNFKELTGFFERIGKTHLHQKLMQETVRFLDPQDGEMGLEFGAGPGPLSHLIASEHRVILHTTDALIDMLSVGEKSYPHHQIIRSRMDAQTFFPRPRERFDFITGTFAFHLMDNPALFLKNCLEWLKPHGRIVILTQSEKMDREMAEKWCKAEELSGETKEFMYGMTNSGLNHRLYSEADISALAESLNLKPLCQRTGFEDSLLLIQLTRKVAD